MAISTSSLMSTTTPTKMPPRLLYSGTTLGPLTPNALLRFVYFFASLLHREQRRSLSRRCHIVPRQGSRTPRLSWTFSYLTLPLLQNRVADRIIDNSPGVWTDAATSESFARLNKTSSTVNTWTLKIGSIYKQVVFPTNGHITSAPTPGKRVGMYFLFISMATIYLYAR